MPEQNFIKNITSKDFKISQNSLNKLIASKNTLLFEELCEKSDFIFPFIKNRIVKNFVDLIQIESLETIFEFSKIYSYDFEDLIVQSWLKFANEDLTDKILELFENGTLEQKAYCAKYFSKINDSLALENLKKYALNDFEPLRLNCAIALCAFRDDETFENAKKIIQNQNNVDEFEKLNAFLFLIAYDSFNKNNSIDFIVKNAFKSPFLINIISYLKNYYSFEILKNNLDKTELLNIFALLIDNYPENITLDTIIDYEILEFIKFLNSNSSIEKSNNQFCKNLLILAKIKFSEYFENEIYSFDLDKETKEELKSIVKFLSDENFDFDSSDINLIKKELETYSTNAIQYETMINVIKELKLINIIPDLAQYLADLINENELNYVLLSKTAFVLKDFNKTCLINKANIENIKNENVKALVLSLF